jgi:hypothetical protein
VPADVFISFAREDDDFARRLTRALVDQGISAFSDTQIMAGEDWGGHLRRALDGSAAILLVMTPAALRSPGVLSEIGAALAAEKLIIPIIPPHQRMPHDMPLPLGRLRFLRTDKLSDNEIAASVRESLDHLATGDRAVRDQ